MVLQITIFLILYDTVCTLKLDGFSSVSGLLAVGVVLAQLHYKSQYNSHCNS